MAEVVVVVVALEKMDNLVQFELYGVMEEVTQVMLLM